MLCEQSEMNFLKRNAKIHFKRIQLFKIDNNSQEISRKTKSLSLS